METNELLFSLLRCEMWDEALPQDVGAGDYDLALAEARRQAVFGMAANALVGHNVPLGREMTMRMYSLLLQIQRRNTQLNAELAAFVAFMARRGIRFVVVKGQVVAQCYPHPEVRQSGDVDLYCDSRNYPLAKEAVEEALGLDLGHYLSAKHVEFPYNGVDYELHSMLSEFAYKPHQVYLDRIIEEDVQRGVSLVKVGEAEVPTLSVTMNALYLFVHIFYHLITSGVGLRQLCDWAMFLHAHKAEIDREALDGYLRGLDLRRAYSAAGAVLVQALGLPEEEFPFALTARDRRRGRRMLKNILRMGNFGHDARRTKQLGVLHSLESGWISFRQSVLFLPLSPMEVLCRVPKLALWFVKKQTGTT